MFEKGGKPPLITQKRNWMYSCEKYNKGVEHVSAAIHVEREVRKDTNLVLKVQRLSMKKSTTTSTDLLTLIILAMVPTSSINNIAQTNL